jgi:hypothetical protein
MRYPIRRMELEEWKAWFSQWQAPAEFAQHVDELRCKAGPSQFFNDPHIAFGRDAFVAAKTATALAVDAVRLCPDTWPDFELRFGGDVRQYEVREADVEDRRRGDEYKATSSEPQFDDWAARVCRVPTALRRAAAAKASKHYPKSAGLVIYLNIGDYGWKRKEIEAVLHGETSAAKDAFRDVWVLWDGRLYWVWDQSERAEAFLV